MENQNQNPSSVGDDVKSMFENYVSDNNNSTGGSSSSKPKIEYLKKMFMPREDTEVFRLISRPGEKPIEEAYFHILEVNDPTKYNGKNRNKKIFCTEKNGVKEPLTDDNGNVILDQNGQPVMKVVKCRACEEVRKRLATQDQSIRGKKKSELTTPQELSIYEKNLEIFKDAMKIDAKKFHILKGIDRNHPLDGVKFWRFKDNAKKQGILDKLVPMINMYDKAHGVYPLDNLRGADLTILMADFPLPNNPTKSYRSVNTVVFGQPTPLHNDQLVVNQWMNDKITWRDVFKETKYAKLTSYEYLDRVLKGTDPYYDEKEKKWIFPDPADAALMQKANERKNQESLEADSNQQQASSLEASAVDMINQSFQQNVNISNVTPNDVGDFNAGVTNVGQEFVQQTPPNNQGGGYTTQGQVQQPQTPSFPVSNPQVQQPQTPNIPVNNPQVNYEVNVQPTSINPADTVNQQPTPEQNDGEINYDDLPF